MRVNECIQCKAFPCRDVKHDRYQIPAVEVDPARVKMILISEAAPDDPANYYFAAGSPSFALTTVQVFNDAGVDVQSIQDLLDRGVYLTTAVKCGKTGYEIETATVQECARLLENELLLFPEAQVFMLMGDVAIKAVNAIAKRRGEGRVIPAGATYKIRGGDFRFWGKPAFPSYVQVGPSFGIEKSKRKMIAEDIAAAIACSRIQPALHSQ
jgi:uracil-DNA glycosylase